MLRREQESNDKENDSEAEGRKKKNRHKSHSEKKSSKSSLISFPNALVVWLSTGKHMHTVGLSINHNH